MSMMQRIILVTLVLVAMPRFAAAQTRDWDDLADDIARRVTLSNDRVPFHMPLLSVDYTVIS